MGQRNLVANSLAGLSNRFLPRLTVKILVIPPLGLYTVGWVFDGLSTAYALTAFPQGAFVENNPVAVWFQSHWITWLAWELAWSALAIFTIRGLRIKAEKTRGTRQNSDVKFSLALVLVFIAVIGWSNLGAGLHNVGQLDEAWKAGW